jgi:uncharacterized repeat protein (TIGR03847 family)
MSTSFDFTDLDYFTAGAVGEPGSRTFFLQVGTGGSTVVSFRCEKQQVGALGEYLANTLRDLPAAEAEELPERHALVQPVVAEWVIGSMGMAYDERGDRLVLLTQELVIPDEDEDEPVDEDPLADLEDEDAATARFHLTRGQAAVFVELAEELVSAGRPSCPICGLPMSPGGHTCPRSNGHGRP